MASRKSGAQCRHKSPQHELPANGLYVEGSVICRLLHGTAGLQRVRSNRVLFVLDDHQIEMIAEVSINSLNAARATYGLDCPQIVRLKPSVGLKAEYSSSGRAVGTVENLEHARTHELPAGVQRRTFDDTAVTIYRI